jgi:hypothetical protein
MTKTIHGRIHCKTIELDEELGVADGREVEVQVLLVSTPRESVFQPQSAPTPEDRGWPPGCFEFAGSIDDETLMRPPQGELPKAY